MRIDHDLETGRIGLDDLAVETLVDGSSFRDLELEFSKRSSVRKLNESL